MDTDKCDSRIRVMLIEDHQTMIWGLQQLINSRHNTMTVVGVISSIDDAPKMAAAVSPDIILLDIDLGGQSGLDLIPILLQNCQAKILMLTGLRDQATLDAAVIAGAKGVVRKEESAEILVQAIVKVHCGQMWMDRDAIGRIFSQIQQKESNDQQAKMLFAVLTRREQEILSAFMREPNAPNKTLAKAISMGENTLRNHLSIMYDKLGVDSRIQLYLLAIEHDFEGSSLAKRVEKNANL